MNRKIEKGLGIVGMVLVTLFLGGFSVVMNQLSTESYQKIFQPVFSEVVKNLSVDEGILLFKTLGAWFAITVVVVLFVGAAASLFITKNKYPKLAGICYFIAGLAALIGSQLLAFPFAFLFFVSSILCFFRKDTLNGTNNNQEPHSAWVQS
ncbi:DUF4064 domain-containing protein [Enterococcus songbeiensis]|uniref:DUF4064 domain-containing protein n=1 Tax=Enterococcus songbeiensis TaxID=2559927 RepID=UPI001484D5EB|nr:DUF4064 domain-containing protein [Enterococcus songbeiensis]